MKKFNRTLLVLASIALCCQLWTMRANAVSVDEQAPNFTLQGTSDKLSLDQYDGDVIMINFWASWCGPCREELPHLEKLHKKYSKVGFTLIGINVDEDSNDAKKLLKDIPVSFPLAFDPKGIVSKQYDLKAMPTTVLIDKSGKVRSVHKGYKKGYEKKYKKEIKALIRE